MSNEANNIANGLEVSTQLPLDGKTYFKTLADVKNLGAGNVNAYKYYEGMPAYCVANSTSYRWREKVGAEVGLIVADFVYPAGATVNAINYGGRSFNFFADSSTGERSLFRGIYTAANGYVLNDLVENGKKLYACNSNITAGTAFVIGTTGATWREVSFGATPLSGNSTWRGTWLQPTAYNTDNFVEKGGKIYKSNGAIAGGTAFVIGTTGATWSELSYNFFKGAYSQPNAYAVNEIVVKDNKFYTPNGAIAGNIVFAIGTTGATWKEVSAQDVETFTTPWVLTNAYTQNSVVFHNGLLYYANTNIPANTAFSTTNFTMISGNVVMMQGNDIPDLAITPTAVATFTTQNNGKQLLYYRTSTRVLYTYNYGTSKWEVASPKGANSWRGLWQLTSDYESNQFVVNNYKVYQSNGIIPANTPFTIGTIGATWKEVSSDGSTTGSNTWRGPWLLTNTYALGNYTEKDDKVYKSNSIIPANTPFAIGVSGTTWKEVSKAELLSGNSTWRGKWLLPNSFIAGDYVEHNDKVYRSNAIIPVNTPFLVGTTGMTWKEVSPSLGGSEATQRFAVIFGQNSVTLSNTPAVGKTIVVNRNGLELSLGGTNDYTIAGTTITFTTAFGLNEVIQVNYKY